MTRFRHLAFVLLMLAPAAHAADCVPTPSVATLHYPGAKNIQNSNNLLAPQGKPIPADGQRVVLSGRVLDRACVPVADASVEMWQVDPFGKWILATGEDLVSVPARFAGAGRATTDQDGVFHFITAFPAADGKRAPNFNLRVHVAGQKDFSTVLFFGADGRNANDPVYAKLQGGDRSRVTLDVNEGPGVLNAGATIVLPYRQQYQGY